MAVWQNRIIGYGEEAPDQLLANPRNFRTHPGSQTDALSGVLREVGIVQNVIVNQRSGFVIDGHARIALALREGQPTIPITYVDLSDSEEAEILATLDPLAAMAGTDAVKLEALLADVTSGEAAVQALLASLAEEAGIVPGVEAGQGGDEFDATPDDGPTRTAIGDLWLIGGVHRLLVGDCTDAANVARLMDGERADAVVTDSPYGINQDGITNDNPEGLRVLFDGVLRCLPVDNAVVMNFQSPRLFHVWIDALRACGHKFERALWLHKSNDVTNPWRGFMMNGEIILVSSVNKAVWPKDVQAVQDCFVVTHDLSDGIIAHASVKPIGVVMSLIDHTTGLVYDPFLGSGTTLIAAHRTNRRCYGLEIEPRYADVILKRAEAEGLTCDRVE